MSQRRAGSSVGLAEVSSGWALFAVFAGAIFWTYARLPARDFFHVSTSGPSGGAGRAFVFLNFPVALVAIAIVLIGQANLHPAVHLGHHHGFDGALLVLTALACSRVLGAMRRPRVQAFLGIYLAVMLTNGLPNEVRSDGSGLARLTDVQADKDAPAWR